MSCSLSVTDGGSEKLPTLRGYERHFDGQASFPVHRRGGVCHGGEIRSDSGALVYRGREATKVSCELKESLDAR